jgi:hypothetical protein
MLQAGRHCLGLRNLDGGNPQAQCATGERRCVGGDGHGRGLARGSDRPVLPKVTQPASPDCDAESEEAQEHANRSSLALYAVAADQQQRSAAKLRESTS